MNPLDVLARHPLFALAPTALLGDWLAAGLTVRFSLGETIFREGSPGEWAYVVLRGRVRVLRRVSSGRELTLGELLPGELFGEYALLLPHQNTATCRAAADSIVVQIPLSGVRNWLARTGNLSSRLKNWMQLHFLLRQLRGQSPFGFMSATSAMAMLPHLTTMDVPAGHAIQADGLCDDRWLFVEQGEVLVESGGASTKIVGPGANLGEAALLGSAVPTVTALSPTRCLTLFRDHFVRPDQPLSTATQSYAAEVLEAPSRVQWIGQKEASDCGVASLAMIAHYHGLSVTPDEIRARTKVGQAGATLGELARAATSIGLSAQAVRVSSAQRRHVHVPAVVHLNNGHYVVLFRLDANGVMLGDPATGIVMVSVVHFAQTASGNVLLLRPRSGER